MNKKIRELKPTPQSVEMILSDFMIDLGDDYIWTSVAKVRAKMSIQVLLNEKLNRVEEKLKTKYQKSESKNSRYNRAVSNCIGEVKTLKEDEC